MILIKRTKTIKKLVIIYIIFTLILIFSGCGYFSSENVKVIKILSHKTEVLEKGINGIKVDAVIYPNNIKNLKDKYILAMFFYDKNKNQIKSKEVSDILKRTYIKDLFYYPSGQGNLAHYREVSLNKSEYKKEYTLFIPYEVLPFYMDYLISKENQKFYIRLDLFYEGKRQAQSDYYEIRLITE